MAYKRVTVSLYKDEFEALNQLSLLNERPLANVIKELAMQSIKNDEMSFTKRSEVGLRKEWDSKEDDEAFKHLQRP